MSGLKYIPRHKRRQQADRLHGAFSGGFSAGYFNTVGSREGWQPRQDDASDADNDNYYGNKRKKQPRPQQQQQQQVEDFMDEQDHSDWGGPRKVVKTLAAGADDGDEKPDDIEQHQHQQQQIITRFSRQEQPHGGYLEAALSSSSAAVVPPKNVGERLLHQLGWRGGSSQSVYLPLNDPISTITTTTTNRIHKSNADDDNDDNHEEENLFLSQRRLYKIQIQQTRIDIPIPKLDFAGLGYEAHESAPEFRAYFERRRRRQAQQQQRWNAQQGGGGGGASQNQYRLADILTDPRSSRATAQEWEDGDHNNNNNNKGGPPIDNSYHDYETMEDFVGKRSVGGFALQEDEDDAFEELKPLKQVTDKIQIDQDEYDTVIQEVHSSSDDDNEAVAKQTQPKRTGKDATVGRRTTQKSTASSSGHPLGNALAAWATFGTQTQESKQQQTTTTQNSNRVSFDGRPVLPGFVLPSSADGPSAIHPRFPGPDLPENYVIAHHVFGPNERPLVLQTLARASQLELEDKRRTKRMEDALETATVVQAAVAGPKPPGTVAAETTTVANQVPSSMIAGNKFELLAQSMKDRFTPAKTDNPAAEEVSDSSKPSAALTTTTTTTTAQPDPQSQVLKITRTIQRFYPSSLLCKRFHVPQPQHAVDATKEPVDTRRREEKFFQDTVLKAVGAATKGETKTRADPVERRRRGATEEIMTLLPDSGTMNKTTTGRPSMDVYRSIFATVVEEEDDNNQDADSKPPLNRDKQEDGNEEVPFKEERSDNIPKQQPDKPPEQETFHNNALVPYQPPPPKKQRRRTWSSDTGTDSSEEQRPRRNERKHSKKKRKKEKKRKKKREVPSDSGSDNDISGGEDSRKRRRRKRSTKHRKKSSSSHHHHD